MIVGWKENSKGNFCRTLDGKLCTVFQYESFDEDGYEESFGWKWVRDGQFSDAVFCDEQEAAEDAIKEFGEDENYDCGF